MEIASLDTPVATVDLDAVERNIARMQGYCDEHGLAFRPHIKTHKLPAIAHMQVRAGAVGITCQKLGEAEVMEAAGLRDILLTFPLVGAAKAERLAALAGEAASRSSATRTPSRAGSRRRSRAPAPRSASSSSATRGFGRTGVQTPEAAADLAELADSLPGLRFDGLMTYPTMPETGPAARGERGDPGARAARSSGQRGRDAHVLSQPRGAGGDRGARRHVRLRRPLVHRRTAPSRSRTARCGSARRS